MLINEQDKFTELDLCPTAYSRISFPTRQHRLNHSDKACTMSASTKILEDTKVKRLVQCTGIGLKIIHVLKDIIN